MVVYAAWVLWLTRGVGFVDDDLPTFASSNGFSPGALLDPYNGHLIAVTRFIFAGSIRIFGAEHAPIQVAVVIAGAAAPVALFALLRRRLAAYPSLALALVVLFFGTTGVPLLEPLHDVRAGVGVRPCRLHRVGLPASLARSDRLRAPHPLGALLRGRGRLRCRRRGVDPGRDRPLAPDLGRRDSGRALRGVVCLGTAVRYDGAVQGAADPELRRQLGCGRPVGAHRIERRLLRPLPQAPSTPGGGSRSPCSSQLRLPYRCTGAGSRAC